MPAACFVWLMERPIPRAYRRAGFHVISESTRDDLVERGVDPAADPGHSSRDRQRGPHTPTPPVGGPPAPSFLYVGRLRRYKGVETAIRALALARQRRPELSLDIAGRGDDQPRLEALAAAARGGRRGPLPRLRHRGAEKLAMLRATWANLFPSAKEGWGITNVEAAACGTPSLASDSPGLRDSVRHGETGFLVPHGSAGGAGRPNARTGRRSAAWWRASGRGPGASPRA